MTTKIQIVIDKVFALIQAHGLTVQDIVNALQPKPEKGNKPKTSK